MNLYLAVLINHRSVEDASHYWKNYEYPGYVYIAAHDEAEARRMLKEHMQEGYSYKERWVTMMDFRQVVCEALLVGEGQ